LVVRLGPHCEVLEVVSGLTGFNRSVAWDGATAWIASFSGVYSSSDFGRTWTQAPLTPRTFETHSLAVAGPGQLVAGGKDGTLHTSVDGGRSWSGKQPFGAVTDPIRAVKYDSAGTLYVGGPNRLSRQAKGGTTWQNLPKPDEVGAGTTMDVFAIYETAGIVVAQYDWRSSGDSGSAWAMLKADETGWRSIWTSAYFGFSVYDVAPLDRFTVFVVGEGDATAAVSVSGGWW